MADNRAPKPGELTTYGKQIQRIKAEYPDTIVLFRLGDFYEAYAGDAYTLAEELDLIVCGREMYYQSKERTPMVGLLCAAIESYMARLQALGHKVAVAEAMGDPASQKVERKITRVITSERS